MKTIDAFKLNEEELKQEIRNNQDIEVDNCLGQRYLGCALKEGNIKLVGTPGNGLAAYLDGASIYVKGNAQDAVADTMNGGLVAIEGNAGDALSYAMRGGKVYILGNAGYRAGVHMKAYKEKRSLLIIGGCTGSFLGEYLAGGTIIVLGLNCKPGMKLTGYFCANGMYAGKIYLRTDEKPVNLSDKLEFHKLDRDEKEEELRPLLEEYARIFHLNLEEILASDFFFFFSDPQKSYKQIYAAV